MAISWNLTAFRLLFLRKLWITCCWNWSDVLDMPCKMLLFPFQKWYETTVPYDPEGLLGTLNSAVLCYLGLQVNSLNTLRLRQNGQHFPDNIFKCIFLNENVLILLKISLMFVPKARINNIPAFVQITACWLLGTKPLSEPMIVSLLTNIYVTRPQWVDVSWGLITHPFGANELNFRCICFIFITLWCLGAVLSLTHWGLDKMADILQALFLSAFSWIENYMFQ